MKNILQEEFFDLAVKKRMSKNKFRLKVYLNSLFKNLEVKNKSFLDVGGGAGIISFYAAILGAKNVICLEPEFDGSSRGMIAKFNDFKHSISKDLPVQHLPITLQTYLSKKEQEKFDIIVFYNSINHINEEACIHLKNDKNSYTYYQEIFASVYNIMNKGGKLIAADCSCNNFYNSISAKNMFAKSIEWDKHQAPSTWIKLLTDVGFKNPKIYWTSPPMLGSFGRILFGNFLAAYFYSSHFKIVLDV